MSIAQESQQVQEGDDKDAEFEDNKTATTSTTAVVETVNTSAERPVRPQSCNAGRPSVTSTPAATTGPTTSATSKCGRNDVPYELLTMREQFFRAESQLRKDIANDASTLDEEEDCGSKDDFG